MNTQPQHFSYEDYWALEELSINPHQERAYELGVQLDGTPVNPTLTSYHTSLQRIETLYNRNELFSEGYDIEAMLMHKTEVEVLQDLEEAGMELTISLSEIERQLHIDEHKQLLCVPKPKIQAAFQHPSSPDDSNAFASIDFERQFGSWRYDNKRYAQDKTAERAEQLALLHSCITDEADKQTLKTQFTSLYHTHYKNWAERAAVLREQTQDERKRAVYQDQIRDCNRQIQRLLAVWQRTAVS
jgi:hypothetical protein